MEPTSWPVLGLGKNVLRFLSECRHRSDERDGTVADARNTEGGQTTRGWDAFHDHHINGYRYAIADPANQRVIQQPGNEKAGRARGYVCLGPLQSFADRGCRISTLAKKQIRPRIDEQRDSLTLRRLANDCDPARLPIRYCKVRSP